MANRTNLELMHNTIRTCSDLYRLENVGGRKIALLHAVSRKGNGTRYAVVNVTVYPSKKAAIAALRETVNPVTLALFDGLCMNHTGKMTGIVSFSTYCGLNPHCMQRAAVPGSICEKCFAFRQTKRQASTREKLIRNTLLINRTVFSASYFPIITDVFPLMRFESFGDLMSANQAANYLQWAAVNKKAHCALWTKNPWYIAQAIENGSKKPGNLNIIFSSNMVNHIEENIIKLYPFIDKVFTVFTDKKAAKAAGYKVNCGARNCRKCRRCYLKTTAQWVIELLK